MLTTLQPKQVHQCILFNLDNVEKYQNKHLEELKIKFPKHTQLHLENLRFKCFREWFKKYMLESD